MKPDDNSNFYKYYDCNKCREEFSKKKPVCPDFSK